MPSSHPERGGARAPATHAGRPGRAILVGPCACRGRTVLVGAIAGALAWTAVIGVATTRRSTPTLPPPRAPRAIGEHAVVHASAPTVSSADAPIEAWEMGLCLVDGGAHDGGRDVIGLARARSTPHTATAVDGRSGEVLWRSAPLDVDARVLCADASTVLAAEARGRIVALDARDGARRWETTLPDDAESTRAGDGCVVVRTRGNDEVGVDLRTGEPTTCSAPVKARFEAGAPRRWTARDGDVVVALDAREVSSSPLTIEATRPGASMWRDDLPLAVEPTDEPFLGVRDGTVIVGAMDLAAPDRLVFVRKDLASGKTVDVRREDTRGSAEGFRAVLGSRFLFVTWAEGLGAYDPVTGERIWRDGPR